MPIMPLSAELHSVDVKIDVPPQAGRQKVRPAYPIDFGVDDTSAYTSEEARFVFSLRNKMNTAGVPDFDPDGPPQAGLGSGFPDSVLGRCASFWYKLGVIYQWTKYGVDVAAAAAKLPWYDRLFYIQEIYAGTGWAWVDPNDTDRRNFGTNELFVVDVVELVYAPVDKWFIPWGDGQTAYTSCDLSCGNTTRVEARQYMAQLVPKPGQNFPLPGDDYAPYLAVGRTVEAPKTLQKKQRGAIEGPPGAGQYSSAGEWSDITNDFIRDGSFRVRPIRGQSDGGDWAATTYTYEYEHQHCPCGDVDADPMMQRKRVHVTMPAAPRPSPTVWVK